MTIYEKLKAGETVAVRKRDGKQFTIQPDRTWGIQVYTVLVDGEAVSGWTGMILSNETLQDWCNQLEEVAI